MSLQTDDDNCMQFMDIECEDLAINTRLVLAIMRGDVDSVRNFIRLGYDLNNNVDEGGNAALHIAAATGNVEIVRLLLEQPSIRTDVRNREEQTPLHLSRTANVVVELVTAGCDVNALDATLSTPLLKVLQDPPNHVSLLECVRLLLSHGAEVNTRDIYSCVPLFYVEFSDDGVTPEELELLCTLVCHGADVNEVGMPTLFLELLIERWFSTAALIVGYVHDFQGVADWLLCNPDDILEVYKFAGEYIDDLTSFILLSRIVAQPSLFATCWKIRSCGTYCVPLLDCLVQEDHISPENFYAVVDCDDFNSSLRIHRPDVLHFIITADMPHRDQEKLICTALTFEDSVDVFELDYVLERHGLNEHFEALMRANVRVEGRIDAGSPLMRVFHPERFGRAVSLLEICRNAVRKCLGITAGNFSYYAAVRRLDIPQSLKDYIILKGTVKDVYKL